MYTRAELAEFSRRYDPDHEARATRARSQFIKDFPRRQLANLTLKDYAIGTGEPTFCAWVEAKTKAWANMQGATSFKFGIYYGKIRSDPVVKYRWVSKKFGKNRSQAFDSVKTALVKLINDGGKRNFKAIDENPLSQMFKAKILGLYFPDVYINVCSASAIVELANNLGVKDCRWVSEAQHLIAEYKKADPVASTWSNPRYMAFLYDKYFGSKDFSGKFCLKKPRKKIYKAVDYDELNSRRREIGKKSEAFALEWERQRIAGMGLRGKKFQIIDCTAISAYGYDFLSFSSESEERYIEVKTVRLGGHGSCSFFLSENEYQVSLSRNNVDRYFFYLVFRGADGEPSHLHIVRAGEVYRVSERLPVTYQLNFEVEGLTVKS